MQPPDILVVDIRLHQPATQPADFTGRRHLRLSHMKSLFWRTHFNMVWRQRTCVTNYVDQQTLKPDDDCVLPHQCLWTFDVLVCPLSATERFLLQPLVCGTVFHRTSQLPPSLSIFCCRLKSHVFSLSYPAF